MNRFPTLHNLHLHLLSLCLSHTYTLPNQRLLKIKGLDVCLMSNGILSPHLLTCGASLVQLQRATVQPFSTHPYKLFPLPRRRVSHSETEAGKMQIFFGLLLLKQVCVCLSGANLTSNLDRIKIVFTPMMCNRVCNGGRCYNNCEKGDITTVYSETSQQQQQQPKSQGFRLCEC